MESRARKLSPYNKSGHASFNSLAELLAKPLADGVSSIKENSRWFDVLYEDRQSDVTLVTFHAALPRRRATYPLFSGRKLIQDLDANFLAFADPACGSAESLSTFWHLGTKRVNAQKFIPAIVNHAKESRSGKHTLFFGSSAGGFAALNYSAQTPDSGVLVVNPRIDLLAKPEKLPQYAEVVYPGWDLSRVKRLIPTSMADLYSKPRQNTVAYLQNTQDDDYFNDHYAPFKEATVGRENVYFKTEAWGLGHVVPPRDAFLLPLKSMVQSAPAWKYALEDGSFKSA